MKNMNMILNGYAGSHIGLVRRTNEDNFVLVNKGNMNHDKQIYFLNENMTENNKWVCIGVFDGMGGGVNGDVAAQIAAETFESIKSKIERCDSKDYVAKTIRNCFLKANNDIVKARVYCPMYGTTGTVICTDGNEFRVFHLGDSRAYYFHDGVLVQLTRDQTLANYKRAMGIVPENSSDFERENHQLMEYIGCDETMESISPIESDWYRLVDGDKLILCTDGLYGKCSIGLMEKILQENSKLEEKVEKLIYYALSYGGEDNITGILLEAMS